ncbi:MAG TPA: polyprenyl synthetase family protein [Ktedonobacterales bacterium]
MTVRRKAETDAIAEALDRYRERLNAALEASIQAARATTPQTPVVAPLLDAFYGQVEYHFGWRDAELRPTRSQPGKLLRPALLLAACELAAAHAGANQGEADEAVTRAIPAAISVELVHNFSLIHDDIEDGDEARHHRATLWKVWGEAHAINTGDGVFAMARLELLRLIERDVAPALVVELAELLDCTCLALCEGQYLDMAFERSQEITAEMYLAMIGRKTAALMACAAQMGGRLGAPDNPTLAERLRNFGDALGMAFQVRDDLLGIWEAADLGKSAAGDVRRKKMTLPVLLALDAATPTDRETLLRVYTSAGQASEQEIEAVLAIFERVSAREQAHAILRNHCEAARQALESIATDARSGQGAYQALASLVNFVSAEAD